MKHHFVLLRHCVRSETNDVYLGGDGDYTYAGDYVADPLPDWQVPTNWCTPMGLDLVESNGAWLVDSGIVLPGSDIELISDDSHRTLDTLFRLSIGIQDELEDESNVSGLDFVHIESCMFSPSEEGVCTSIEDGLEEAILERLANLRRPDLDFAQALRLLEKIAGRGKVGSLVQKIPLESKLNYDGWDIAGAAALIEAFSQILFYAKAGLEQQDFASHTTVEQVYQLLQFAHWVRSVLNVDNQWSATEGAAWAKILLTVLSKGSLYDAPRPGSDSLTLFAGHDSDLNTFQTALGVTWDPPEYQTYPEFAPTPPVSGLHFVRDTETDEIQASFVYPVYHKEGFKYWKTDKSGPMKRVPLLWKDIDSFESRDQVSAIPSLEELESHILSTLAKYPGALECFYTVAKKLASETVKESGESSVSSTRGSVVVTCVVVPIGVLFSVAVLCIAHRIIRTGKSKEYSRADNDEYH